MTTTQQVVAPPEKCVRPVGDPPAKVVATPQTRALPHASALNLKPCGLSNLPRFVARQVRGPSLRDRGEQERSAAQQTYTTHTLAMRPRVRADPRSATIGPHDGAPEHAEEGTAEHLQHRTAGSFHVLAAWPAPSGCRCVKIRRIVALVPIRSPGGFHQTVPESAEGVRCALTARPSAADSGSRLEDGKDERCAPACIPIHTSNE